MPEEGAVNQQELSRRKVLAASVNEPEEGEILLAFEQASFGNKSKAARVVLLAYARSAKVRDSVAAFLRDNLDILAA